MNRHLGFGLALLLLTAAPAVRAQSYPPPGPYPPGSYPQESYPQGTYDDQGYPDQEPYYSDDQTPDQNYPPDYATYDNQGPVDQSYFYAQLAPYGRWIQRAQYGWVWEPTRVRVGWRPYTQGRWVYTDAGWTWVSEEPWGWATYHYGRWLFDPEYGWLWVPGTEWGPAWVAFQEGDGYIGWAPLPPSVGFTAGFGIQLGGLRIGVDLDPYAFSFVPEREFLRDRVESVILPPARNVTLVRSTRNITRIGVENNRVVNQSVPTQRIEQVTGQPVRRLRLSETRTPVRGRTEQIQGDQVSVFRPAERLARPAPSTTPPAVIQRQRQVAQQRQQTAQPGQPQVQPVPPPARPAPSMADLERKHQMEQQQLQARQEALRNRLQQMRQSEGQQPPPGRGQDMAAQRQAEERALQEQNQREQRMLQARQQREQQAAQNRAQQQRQAQQQQPPPRNQQQKQQREQQRRQPPPPPPPF